MLMASPSRPTTLITILIHKTRCQRRRVLVFVDQLVALTCKIEQSVWAIEPIIMIKQG